MHKLNVSITISSLQTGKLCSYRLGESVRRKYINFLGSYVPGCVDAITTACERTQASLQLFLAGLYPPEGELIWNKHLMWQPIPYGCEDPPLDKVFKAVDFGVIGTREVFYRSWPLAFVTRNSKNCIANIRRCWVYRKRTRSFSPFYLRNWICK